MEAIDIARRMAELGQSADACAAYRLALHQGGLAPHEELEAAVCLLQCGEDYKLPYTVLLRLYQRELFQPECLDIMTQAFYEPNVKQMRSAYERNCKALSKYPYLFRRDFVPFEDLPVHFYPYDEKGYLPFFVWEERFGDYTNFKYPVVSRNFFKDLNQPVLARDVFSQYELEYLRDNVRKSEYIGRENHIYLHYTDWGAFCAHLQCLDFRPLLKEKKFVFLIGDEAGQYPIDFKARFGVDYSQYPVKPVGIREVNRMIWHTQLSSHNGGDFFNEVFDGHPNLINSLSLLFDEVEQVVEEVRTELKNARSAKHACELLDAWPPALAQELYLLRDRTDKDIFTALFLKDPIYTDTLDPASRIAPVLFFQPHFGVIQYGMTLNENGGAVISSEEYEQIRASAIFRGFPYIKTFTPLRRATTSYGAAVRFTHRQLVAQQKNNDTNTYSVMIDALLNRVLNRSFMYDPEDRLYQDSVVVRFEDAKLNPKATFTALAAFLDLPYDQSMERCTMNGKQVKHLAEAGRAPGFGLEKVYNTYDEYTNDTERAYLEYFLRDVYASYGYDFHYYDGAPVDDTRIEKWLEGFVTLDKFIRMGMEAPAEIRKEITANGESLQEKPDQQALEALADQHMAKVHATRKKATYALLRGPQFVNRRGQPLRMMPLLEPDPALLEQPLYR